MLALAPQTERFWRSWADFKKMAIKQTLNVLELKKKVPVHPVWESNQGNWDNPMGYEIKRNPIN